MKCSGLQVETLTSKRDTLQGENMVDTTADNVPLQGYLAHKKPPTLGPYSRPMPKYLW